MRAVYMVRYVDALHVYIADCLAPSACIPAWIDAMRRAGYVLCGIAL